MSFHQLRSPYFKNAAQAITIPSVTTNAATSVASTTATGNGSLDSTGGSTVTALGFVWATHPSPTLADNVVTDAGTALGAYSDTLTGLPTSTLIYYAAYATNSIGTAYGADQTFNTTSGVTSVNFLALLGVG